MYTWWCTHLIFILLFIRSQEDGHTDVSHIPHVSPRTFQTLVVQEVVGRHNWCQLHELLCGFEALQIICGTTCTCMHAEEVDTCTYM